MTSPTERTLAYYKKLGWPVDVSECWNPWAGKRSDLFGFIDIVVLSPTGIIGVQTTSAINHKARVNKIMGSVQALHWLRAGGKIVVMSWDKSDMREEEITVDSFQSS